MVESVGSYVRSLGPIDLNTVYSKDGQAKTGSTLTRWTSKASGLKVVLINSPSPIVSLYAAVRTEVFNDFGIPHTLEHAIFLGSEQYKYKGVLDTLANRSFAAGTNAWTDTTNTTYTIDTAGSEGFLNILPVYMDHILYPTMTDEGFTTEVYHINGNGEDAGVVFSEMQGRENGPYDLMALQTQRALYPKTSGYRSETGGLMEALRVLTIEQIREYHAQSYLPHNICLIVNGSVDPQQLLEKLEQEVEPRIAKHGQNHGSYPKHWKRPWIESTSAKHHGAPLLDTSSRSEIEFPEADESVGEWQRVYRGLPHASFFESNALDILCTYLTESAVAPLTKELVEIAEPYCTDISHYFCDTLTSSITFMASSVPSEHLKDFEDKFQAVLQDVATKGFDMQRIRTLIDRSELKLLNAIEKNAGEALMTTVLSDFLFGDEEGENMNKALQDLQYYKELRDWSSEKWIELFNSYLVDAPSFTIIGKPSAQLAEKNEKETAERIEATKKKYGEDGLKKLDEKLKAAQKVNDTPIPDEILSSFPIPSVDSINFIDVESARSEKGWAKGAVQKYIDSDSAQLPYLIQYDHINSNFLTITLHLFPEVVPRHLLKLLSLYTSSFFSLPFKRSGKTTVGFEDVIRLLDENTIKYNIAFGQSISEDLSISFRIEKSKYSDAIQFARDLLYHSVFDIERLVVTASKNVQNLPSEKREGNDVAASARSLLVVDEKKSISISNSLLYRSEHDPKILQRLKDDPNSVVAELEELRKHLSDPSTFRISVTGDILSLPEPKTSWLKNFEAVQNSSSSLSKIRFASDTLSPLGKNPSQRALLYSLASIDSTFGYYFAKGPAGFNHADAAPLTVVCALMNALESFLWRNIRGAGLAYGAWITNSLEAGSVSFNVFKSPDATKAFEAAKKIISALASGEEKIDQLLLESSKSSLAYKTANQQSNITKAADVSFANQVLLGVPQSYQRDLLTKCADVTSEDCRRVIKQYLVPLFSSKTSIAAIASAKAKTDSIKAALEKVGYEVEVRAIEEEEEGSSDDASDTQESTTGMSVDGP